MSVFIKQFLANPAGKGATFMNMSALRAEMDKRYESVKDKLIVDSYVEKKIYYLHVKLPSSVNNVFYDVVLKFEPDTSSKGKSIDDMPMRLFSNSPSFIYTYAHTYKRHDIFINELRDRLAKHSFDKSETKNAYNIVSYDFSIYCGLKVALEHTSLDDLNSISKGGFKELKANIKTADLISGDRKREIDNEKAAREEAKAVKSLKHESKATKEDKDEPVKEAPEVSKAPKVKKIAKSKSKIKKL